VAGDEFCVNHRQISLRNMQVGPANSTRQNAQQHLACLQLGTGYLLNFKEWFGRRTAGNKNGSFHFLTSSSLSLRALVECS
jgi:hypothetical protein